MEVTYRRNPTRATWSSLIQSAYESDYWSMSVTDLQLWRKAFGKRFEILVAFDPSFYPVGCICATTYSHRSSPSRTTFIGFFYVIQRYRGNGIGNELFRQMISDKKNCNLYLNSSWTMIEKYRLRYNFSISTDWKFRYYEVNPAHLRFTNPRIPNSSKIVNLNETNLQGVLKYDDTFHDLERSTFMKLFLTQDCAETKVAHEGDNVIGVGTARLLPHGHLFIGPLYAKDQEIAKTLLLQLIRGRYYGRYVNIQFRIPTTNENAKQFLDAISGERWTSNYYTIGLSTQSPLLVNMAQVYCICEDDLSAV
ncbi:unnamed protein product [Auanema sp. JU1783]|nr:unnamed protein product [Auanema sp. JU1783]